MEQHHPAMVVTRGFLGLVGLPPEIIVTIMSLLPNRSSLLSMLLTCHSFNDTYEDSALPILLSILLREVPALVLTDALWCFKALSVVEHGHDAILDFLESYTLLVDPQTILSGLPVAGAEIVDYIEIHQGVLYWTRRLCERFKMIEPFGSSRPAKAHELSSSERDRIQRTLYRYELCSILFQTRKAPKMVYNVPSVEYGYRLEYFFKKLNHLEREQLRCIYDFLFWYTADDFYAKCEHDVLFGEFVDPSNSEELAETHPRREYMLAQGIRYLRSMDKESTSVERCSWIPNWGLESAFLGSNFRKLAREKLDIHTSISDDRALHDISEVGYLLWGDDSGQDFHMAAPEITFLRSWAYCLWDPATLQSIQCLGSGAAVPDRAREWTNAKEQELNRADERAIASQRARRLIFSRGGRGWYDKEGQSYIRWEYGGPELHYLPGEEPPGWTGPKLEDDEKKESSTLEAP